MSRLELPQGYTVAQIDGKWYPLQVEWIYTADFPNGFLSFSTFYAEPDYEHYACYSRRHEAVHHCQEDAELTMRDERRKWERLTARSNTYPERCAQYVAEIEAVRGRAPQVEQYEWLDMIIVFVPARWCAICQHYAFAVRTEAFVIEDALEDAAQQCYETRCGCHRLQELRLSAA